MKIEKVEETVSLRRSLDRGTEEQRKAVLAVMDSVKKTAIAPYSLTQKSGMVHGYPHLK